MKNFTASWLGFLDKKLVDELGHPISTIVTDKNSYPIGKYVLPSIEYDILAKGRVLAPPMIKKLTEAKEVEKLGFVVCSVPVNKNTAWRRGQRCRYILANKNSMEAQDYTKVEINRNPGRVHYVEFDEANRLIRIIGVNASKDFYGPWLEVDDA